MVVENSRPSIRSFATLSCLYPCFHATFDIIYFGCFFVNKVFFFCKVPKNWLRIGGGIDPSVVNLTLLYVNSKTVIPAKAGI